MRAHAAVAPFFMSASPAPLIFHSRLTYYPAVFLRTRHRFAAAWQQATGKNTRRARRDKIYAWRRRRQRSSSSSRHYYYYYCAGAGCVKMVLLYQRAALLFDDDIFRRRRGSSLAGFSFRHFRVTAAGAGSSMMLGRRYSRRATAAETLLSGNSRQCSPLVIFGDAAVTRQYRLILFPPRYFIAPALRCSGFWRRRRSERYFSCAARYVRRRASSHAAQMMPWLPELDTGAARRRAGFTAHFGRRATTSLFLVLAAFSGILRARHEFSYALGHRA